MIGRTRSLGRGVAWLGVSRRARVSVLSFVCLVAIVTVPVRAGDGDSLPGTLIHFYQRYISDLRAGKCYFEPSCSRHASEAIATNGLVAGLALSADRLVRCDAGARGLHRANESGRLLDDPSGLSPVPDEPRTPAWLMPPVPAAPPIDAPDEATRTHLSEILSFAEFLAREGECWRAATEYKRLAFLSGTEAMRHWTFARIGWCYHVHRDPDALDAFLEAALHAPTGLDRDRSLLWSAGAAFDDGEWSRCRRILNELPGKLDRTAPPAERGVLGRAWTLGGLVSMVDGEWTRAEAELTQASALLADSPDASRSRLLASRAAAGSELSTRSPGLAGVLSAVIPGAGQVYAGRVRLGLRHLLFNALLGAWLYQLIDDEQYTGAYLVAGVQLPFYLGNVLGAGRTAARRNRAVRARFLSESIRTSSGDHVP